MAEALGKPFMPWQRQVADIALELDPDTGELVYREVDLVVMRQQGKTEFLLPLMAHRCVGFGRDQRVLYTTQTAIEARKKWEDVHIKRLGASPLRGLYRTRLRLTQEAILWANGSAWSPASTTAKTGGTGDQVDLGVIDEAWSRDDSRTEQGMRPAMLTRRSPQLWIASMIPGPTRAKTTSSSFLRQKMKAGRARAQAGLTRNVAYFEFSAQPGLDPSSPDTWWSCMPALGHTITEAAVASDFESMALDDFTSEYLGWWPDESAAGWELIGQHEWQAAARPESQLTGRPAIAVKVPPDRSYAAIAVAGPSSLPGRWHIEITGDAAEQLDYRPGTAWVIPRLREMERHQPCALVIDDKALAGEAAAAGLTVLPATVSDVVTGAQMLYDGVCGPDPAGRTVVHLGQGPLSEAARGAAKRAVGKNWAFTRADLTVDVTPLDAASLALAAARTPRVHRPEEAEPWGVWLDA